MENLLRWTATIAVLLACGGGRAATNPPAFVAGWVCVEIPPGTMRVIALPFSPFPDDAITVPEESDDRPPLRVFTWSARNQAYLSADAVLKPTGHPGQWTIDDPTSPAGSVYLVENSSAARQWIFLGGRVGVDSIHKGILEPGLNLLGCPLGFELPEKLPGFEWMSGVGLSTNGLAEGSFLASWGYLHDPRSSQYILKPVDDALATDCPVPVSVTGVNGADGIRLTLSGKGRVWIRTQDLAWTIQTGWIAGEQMSAGIVDLDGGPVGWHDTNMPVQVGDRTGLGRLYYLTMAGAVPEAIGSAPDVDGAVVPAAAVTPANTFLKTQYPAGLSDGDLSIPGTSSPTEGADLVCREGKSMRDGIRVLHVSAAEGDDRFSGRKPDRDGADGPKRTIGAAVTGSADPTVVFVYDGCYPETVRLRGCNVNVVIQGKVTLRKE